MDTCDEGEPLTACVVSQCYRATEVFLHPQHYSFPLDMWSVGCIFAELFKSGILLLGKDTLDQFRQKVVIVGSRIIVKVGEQSRMTPYRVCR